jgi:hypothetical protein
MPINRKITSKKVASTAAKTLTSKSASNIQKSLAGSALRQAGTRAQTGAAIESKAGKALSRTSSAKVTKSLAGSVVSQSNKSR